MEENRRNSRGEVLPPRRPDSPTYDDKLAGMLDRDPIVMAADAAKAACIERLRRAIAATIRLRAMPLTAEECITLLQHMTWDEGLPEALSPSAGESKGKASVSLSDERKPE